MDMDKKLFKGLLEVKQDGQEQGLVRAVFATLNVIDADGDVTLPGAFGNQSVRLGAWGHAWQELPVGKGSIKEEEDKAIFDGAFFLDTEAGREHYLTVKNLAELQEWSYGFRVLESEEGEFEGRQVRFLKKMDVYEVSPVMQGAGVDTVTVAIKGDKVAIAPHSPAKAPEDTPWSAPTLADFTSDSWADLSDAEKKRIAQHFVWAASMPPEKFGDLKGPHHKPATSGLGAVVWRGVANCAARMGQMDIPDADMAGVKRHLAGHYQQFDREPPWEGTRGWTYADHAEHVLASVQAFTERSRSLADLRSKEGRTLSAANRELLAKCAKEIAELLESTKPAAERGEALRAAYLGVLARQQGVPVQ